MAQAAVEQMRPGALGAVFTDRPSPFADFDRVCEDLVGMNELPLALPMPLLVARLIVPA